MNLNQFTDIYRPQIESALHQYLTFRFQDSRSTLEDAVQYSVFAKAKRIRPLIVIAAYSLFQKSGRRKMGKNPDKEPFFI